MDTSPPRTSTAARGDATRAELRRLNLIMLLPPVAAAGALTVALDSTAWWHVAVLSAGVLAALVAFVRWTSGELLRVALPCLVVSGAVWLVGALAIDSGTSFFGILIIGPLVVPELPRHRAAAALGTAGFVAAVGVAKLLLAPEASVKVLIAFVILPTGLTVIVTGLMFPNKRFYDVVKELEESREREAELAVIRERVRFASDLHDIQGHTLHVVKLKVALAQKLLHTDIDRVAEELREVHALVADTITQTKELAHAQRRLNLSAELENAKNLFEAAGIRVHVDRRAEVDARSGELLGQVLRETTTNILRHAQAREVRITLNESDISIVNDGAQEGPLPELRGLSALRQRVAADGGDLAVTQEGGRFTTAAALPRLPADPARRARGKDDR